MHATSETPTDYEMLENAFGSRYFIFNRITNKIALNERQTSELHRLIDDRNHFEILNLVNSLRRG